MDNLEKYPHPCADVTSESYRSMVLAHVSEEKSQLFSTDNNEKCRNAPYPSAPPGIERFHVPDDKCDWDTPFPDYSPTEYTASIVLKNHPGWADHPTLRKSTFYFNPAGRTGMMGRGLLGKWGSNYASDPVVAWIEMDPTANLLPLRDPVTGRVVVHFCLIQRGGQSGAGEGEWAIPGGMVETEESVSQTLAREFKEEAINGHNSNPPDVIAFFDNCGRIVYQGYVDDPRNTDEAWMHTTVKCFIDEGGKFLSACGFSINGGELAGGDDAHAVKMVRWTPELKLFASHTKFLGLVADHIEQVYHM